MLVSNTAANTAALRVRQISGNQSYAIQGISNLGIGVYGSSSNPSSSQPGVYGAGTAGTGVFGYSTSNAGIFGQSGSSGGLVGVSGAIGLWGVSTSPQNAPKPGARGDSTWGPGVYGTSANNAGVFGDASAYPGQVGVFGKSGTGTGIVGQATDSSGFAAQFFGTVNVVGDLIVSGSAPKSAAVPHPDGTQRRMYCMEAPESYFEDFGIGQLTGGVGTVVLDRDFAAVVKTDQYQVFLTPEGTCEGLYVSGKGPSSFEVRELRGGTSSVTFCYRIVAKRGDIASPRMERLDKVTRALRERAIPSSNIRHIDLPQPPQGVGVPTPPGGGDDAPRRTRGR
ncbi:MAG: hypothetical protein AB7K36_05220 [Chloroflexota bacterium]